MKSISEAMREFSENEKNPLLNLSDKEKKIIEDAEFHIEVMKPKSGSYQELIDEFDTFLAMKGVRSSALDMNAGKLVFKKHEEVMKAKKVLDKSKIYKDKFKTSLETQQ